MTIEQFNEKWKDYLEEDHYGLAIDDEKVINYLDEKFTELQETVPEFTYAQIKLKFGYARVYMEPYDKILTSEIEEKIDELLIENNPYRKGDKVIYTPFPGCDESLLKKGIVKNPANGTQTFVVYNYNNDPDHFEEYTAALTNNKDLKKITHNVK